MNTTDESHMSLTMLLGLSVVICWLGICSCLGYSDIRGVDINYEPVYVHISNDISNIVSFDNASNIVSFDESFSKSFVDTLIVREKVIYGVASYYAHRFNGRLTANGEIYDMYSMTVAHRTLPFNTLVKIEDKNSGKMVYARVNDRGPYIEDREIDLSLGVAQKLDMVYDGLHDVKITVLGQAI